MTDYFEDDVLPAPTEEQRRRIIELCRRQVREERRVEDLERELGDAREALRVTSEVDLPALMAEAGVHSEPLSNRARVDIVTEYKNGELQNPLGLAYLDRAGAGSLARYTISLTFAKGHQKLVRMLLKRIGGWKDAPSFSLTEKCSVHHGTLKSWVRERVRSGADVDFDAIGVHVRRVAKIVVEDEPEDGL